MTLSQRIANISKHVQVRHYHRPLPKINGSRPFVSSSTARPSVMQQAFNKILST